MPAAKRAEGNAKSHSGTAKQHNTHKSTRKVNKANITKKNQGRASGGRGH